MTTCTTPFGGPTTTPFGFGGFPQGFPTPGTPWNHGFHGFNTPVNPWNGVPFGGWNTGWNWNTGNTPWNGTPWNSGNWNGAWGFNPGFAHGFNPGFSNFPSFNGMNGHFGGFPNPINWFNHFGGFGGPVGQFPGMPFGWQHPVNTNGFSAPVNSVHPGFNTFNPTWSQPFGFGGNPFPTPFGFNPYTPWGFNTPYTPNFTTPWNHTNPGPQGFVNPNIPFVNNGQPGQPMQPGVHREAA